MSAPSTYSVHQNSNPIAPMMNNKSYVNSVKQNLINNNKNAVNGLINPNAGVGSA